MSAKPLIHLDPPDKYRNQIDGPEPQVRKEDIEPLPVPDLSPEPQRGGGADPKTVLGQPQYADSTRLEKQIEGGGSSKKSTKKTAATKSSVRTPAVEDYVNIRRFPHSLYDVIDRTIDVPDATQSEKVAAFVYSLIGDDDMRDVSLYIKELADNYGFDTANEIRGLRDTLSKVAEQSDTIIRMTKDLYLLNDQELFALSFVIFHRLGFSMQPPVAPAEVNFKPDGVEEIRQKLGKDWKVQREEKKRKDGIRLK